MPVSSIPVPAGNGMDAFDKGATSLQNIFNSIAQKNNSGQQLAINQAANARAQTLLPYMIQQYKNQAAQSQMQQQLLGGGQPQSPAAQPTQSINGATSSPQQPYVPTQEPAPENKIPVADSLHSDVKDNLTGSDEKLIRNGDPSRATWDRLAGMSIGNVRIPAIQTSVQDGVQYQRYPSGKITATKVAPSKAEGEQTSADIQQGKKVQDSSLTLQEMAAKTKELSDLMYQNPNLGGVLTGMKVKHGWSTDPNAGKFQSLAGDLQSTIGRYASSRGGQGVLNWAKNVKPDVGNQPQYNRGMIDQMAQNVNNEAQILKAEYKQRTGKDLKINIPDFSPPKANQQQSGTNEVTFTDSNGKEWTIPKDKLDIAKQRDPGLKLKG